MSGFGVGGGVPRGHDGLENAKEGRIFSLERRFLDVVGFKLTGEASVQFGVGLGVWRLSRVREATQEAGLRNHPLRLRNRLFIKPVQASLGSVGMLDPVSVYL